MRNDISMHSCLLIGEKFEGSEEFDNIESVWYYEYVAIWLSVTSSSSWNCFCFCVGCRVKEMTTYTFVVKKKYRHFFFLPFFLLIFFLTFWLFVSLAGLFLEGRNVDIHVLWLTWLRLFFFFQSPQFVAQKLKYLS